MARPSRQRANPDPHPPAPSAAPPGPAAPRRILYCVFLLSGLVGLVYEASWTRYLQLFLGHAAYAQVLVLVLFMGGMGGGALLTGRLQASRFQPLVLYALIEAALGIAGIAFHPVYAGATAFAYDTLLPGISGESAALTAQWTLAAVLIVPQSLLLGMTFPLMSAALLRREAAPGGRVFALLYFANSAGAVVGVLLTGFWLTPRYGLPATMMIAGAGNLLVAAVAFALARLGSRPLRAVQRPAPAALARGVARGLLAIAFLTAVSSFLYEIAWLRMLALVQGASTHAFETMLSAFILGIAAGGFWIRNRIDRLRRPLLALALVQIAMGLAAVATLPLYPHTFDLMQQAMPKLPRTELGYLGFNAVGWLLSAAIMVPASFCAGMTLPLLTAVLYRSGRGESEVGRVYGWNTLGSVAGVALGSLWLMPAIGLKNTIIAGAALDVALGTALLIHLARTRPRATPIALPAAFAAAACVALGLALFALEFDQKKLVSGVFRFGRANLPPSAELLSYADGRTATVSVVRQGTGSTSIATNGKIDAAINMERGRLYTPSPDEYTMSLLAALPLAYAPWAKRAAVIGHGTGLTAHVLLGSPVIERLDLIEIEPEMVRASRAFLPRVARAYDDPRSHFHFDDARAFFARSPAPYDIIVSEPSNPWISGVASLFTPEFYGHASRALAPNGLFVQWFHLYEIDRPLVRSIIGAIGQVFPDYAIYVTNDTDAVLVATKEAALPPLTAALFEWPDMKAELARLDIQDEAQLRLFRIAGRRAYKPLLEGGTVNTDYFPLLEFGAARTRFTNVDDAIVAELARDPVPILEMLSRFTPPLPARGSAAIARESPRMRDARRGNALAAALNGEREPQADDGLTPVDRQALPRVRDLAANIDATRWQEWFSSLLVASKPMIAHGSADALAAFVRAPRTAAALERAPVPVRENVAFLLAVGARDLAAIERDGARLLEGPLRETDPAFHAYALVSTITACLAQAIDATCPETVALLDLVQTSSPVFDLLRAHQRQASVR